MIGILTEKPSAMRNFAKALGGKKGKFNDEEFVLVHARGHLFEYASPDQQVDPEMAARYKSWDLSNLPWSVDDINWKREQKSGAGDLLKSIRNVLSKCSEIVIATDDDPTGEGELLAWEILSELNLKPEKYSRMYFVDESVPSIQKAFVKRKPIQSMHADNDFIKAQYRSQWDFLSMQWTRIATQCADGKTIIRQGRLKSAMVRLVGDQCAKVKAYKKVPFYQLRYKDENGNVFTSEKEPKYEKPQQVSLNRQPSSVVVDSREKKSVAPDRLIDLAALSSIMASKGVKAASVLEQVQKMYEHSVVSYPRSEDKTITPEQFAEMLPRVDKIAKLVGINPAKLTHREPRRTHVKTAGSHGANRPGINVPKKLDDLEIFGPDAPQIYVILARSFLSMFAEDYIYESVSAHVKDDPDFKATIQIPVSMGYREVFYNPSSSEKEEDKPPKEFGKRAAPFIYEGFPPKPEAPTMKWLMKQLEKYDVGTGATRTSIYADVTNSRLRDPLLQEVKGKLSMAPAGDISYFLLANTHIGDIRTTERLQQEMREIARSGRDPKAALDAVEKLIVEDMSVMAENGEKWREQTGRMLKKEKEAMQVHGTWMGKEISFKKTWGTHEFTKQELTDLFDGKTIVLANQRSSKGTFYDAHLKLEEQVFKGHKFVAPKLQATEFPKTWCSHVFTPEEAEALKRGETVYIEGFVSKKGNVFSSAVKYEKGRIVPDFA